MNDRSFTFIRSSVSSDIIKSFFSIMSTCHVPHDTCVPLLLRVFLLLCRHAQCVQRRVSILSTLTGVDTITETPVWTLWSTAAWRSPVLLVDSTSEQEVNRSHDHRMCFIPHRLQCLSLFLSVSVNKAWIQTSLKLFSLCGRLFIFRWTSCLFSDEDVKRERRHTWVHPRQLQTHTDAEWDSRAL